jgi:hypothetical protein
MRRWEGREKKNWGMGRLGEGVKEEVEKMRS